MDSNEVSETASRKNNKHHEPQKIVPEANKKPVLRIAENKRIDKNWNVGYDKVYCTYTAFEKCR